MQQIRKAIFELDCIVHFNVYGSHLDVCINIIIVKWISILRDLTFLKTRSSKLVAFNFYVVDIY